MVTRFTNIKFYFETCCDYCNEVIHTHFDCPICKKEYVNTDCYGQLGTDDEFICKKCKAGFKVLCYDQDNDSYIIELLD